MESEKTTEKYLAGEMVKLGGWSLKFTCPNVRGVPDRICMFPSGDVVFVELKSEGVRPEKHQLRMHDKMRGHGAFVYVVDTKEQVDRVLAWFK